MLDYIFSRFNSFSLDTGDLTPGNLVDRSKMEFSYLTGSETLIVALPGWNQPLWCWGRVRNLCARLGYSSIMYEFPTAIFSSNSNLTHDCFVEIGKWVRDEIHRLRAQYKFKRCILLGYSLATSYGSLVYKDNADIDEIVLVVPGNNLAEPMWTGCRTQHMRKAFERQGTNMDQLKVRWNDLASENNLPNKGTRIHLHIGERDRMVPTIYGKKLAEVLSQKGFNPEIKLYPYMGHYGLIARLLLSPQNFIRT